MSPLCPPVPPSHPRSPDSSRWRDPTAQALDSPQPSHEALGVVLFTFAVLLAAIGAALSIIVGMPLGEVLRILVTGS